MSVVNEELDFPGSVNASSVEVIIRLAGLNGEPIKEAYAGGRTIVGTLRPVVAGDGTWTADLVPNSTIVPAGTRWRRDVIGSTIPITTVFLNVPAGGPWTVSAILSEPPGVIDESPHSHGSEYVDLTTGQTVGGAKTFTGGTTTVAPSAGVVALITKGFAGQTANLQDWRSSTSVVLAAIDSSGSYRGANLQSLTGGLPYLRFENPSPRFISQGAAQIPLIIQGAASQTADLQQWQDSAGTVKALISTTIARLPDGSVVAGNGPGISFVGFPTFGFGANAGNLAAWVGGTIGLNLSAGQFRIPSDWIYSWASTTNNNAAADTSLFRNSAGVIGSNGVISSIRVHAGRTDDTANWQLSSISSTAANIALVVRGAASQTGDLQQWQNSAGTVLSYVDSAGVFNVARINTSGTGFVLGAASQLLYGVVGSFVGNVAGTPNNSLRAAGAAHVPLEVRGAASQTGDLQQWQNSTPATLFAVTAAGLPRWTAAASVQTTVGAAGGASALPATPVKYLKVVDDAGVTRVVPAYIAA